MQNTVADSFDVTTLLGSKLGISLLLPMELDKDSKFTLNYLLNVFPDDVGEEDEIPKLRYFGVGINGCYNADDTTLQSAYNPKRTDMNLYSLIPIRCRPVDEDLSASERANYLNPTPEKPSTSTTVETSATSVVAYAEASITLEAKEILEYISIMYSGDTRYAKISEIGFFTGIDSTVTKDSVTYTESLYTQLYNHVTWLGANLTREGMSFESTFQINSNGSISEE